MDQNQTQQTVKTEPKSDRINNTRTIYDASSTEIMWKNFLAGLMRGFGSVLVWFFFMIVVINVFLYFAWPSLKPFVEQYQQALSTITTLNQAQESAPTQGIDLEGINSLIQQFQTSQ